LLLARAGFGVDLIEQHTFPRDKVCGECLSGVGMDVLQRAGVLNAMELECPALLTRSLLHPTDGPMIEVPLPRASMGISRLKMDVILLKAAVNAGARLHQPARCEAVFAAGESAVLTQAVHPCSRPGSTESDVANFTSVGQGRKGRDTRLIPARPSVRWRDLRSNQITTQDTDWILVADGKGALLRFAHKSTGDLGIKTHFTNVYGPRDAIELFAGHGNYGGIAAVEADRWNAAFSVPAALVRRYSGDVQKLFDWIVAGNLALRARLSNATRTGPWLASPLPRFAVSDDWRSHVIPIGNAAAALEPVGGEGMGLALRSAEMAATAVISAERSGSDQAVQNLPAEFNRLWRLRRTICRSIAMMFSSEYVANAVAPLMAANVGIPTAFMRLAGKAQR
jgi:2-polyprenyl-6-methoxyphenol hydroxylase-like FAD-dependent oxidoreductase